MVYCRVFFVFVQINLAVGEFCRAFVSVSFSAIVAYPDEELFCILAARNLEREQKINEVASSAIAEEVR